MDFKPVSKSTLKAEIQRLQSEVSRLFATIEEAQLPEDTSLVGMRQHVYWAAGQLKESAILLDRADEKFTDAFDYVSTQG
jgi:hypothetical protein